MYAEERRFDTLLRAKQDNLQSAYYQLQAAKNDSAAGEEAPHEHLVSRYYSRCPLTFQPEADQLDQERRARVDRFQREERVAAVFCPCR